MRQFLRMESQCSQHYLLVHELVVLTWNLSTTSIVEVVTVLIRQLPQLSLLWALLLVPVALILYKMILF